MNVASRKRKWVHLHHDDDADGYVIHTRDGDRFVFSLDEMIGAGKVVDTDKDFATQFRDFYELVEAWLTRNAQKLDRAYLSIGNKEIDLTLVLKSKELDRELDDSLIDLDIRIAQDESLSLIRFNAMSLPYCNDTASDSFVRKGGTFRRDFAREPQTA